MHAFKKSPLLVESLINHDPPNIPSELRNIHSREFKIIHVCKKSQLQVQSLINDDSSNAPSELRAFHPLALPKLLQSIIAPKDQRSMIVDCRSSVKKIDYHSKKNHMVTI